jgi:DNA mismatch repair protein MutL
VTEPIARPIAVLPDEVVARIAAGEVIERPASVVKELVENACDAGARRIEVLIEGGGLERIRVADDGRGIPADQVELAFARHGTSKLRHDLDLGALRTLGFRGEALPSIAAVADVRCQSRSADEAVGFEVRLTGGRPIERRPLARQPGTTITVDDLFAELPARRKFLRARATESATAVQVASHLALARPDLAFRLVVDGRQVFATTGSGDLRAAALAVRGAGFAQGAHELPAIELTAEQGRHLGRLWGLLGPTREQRSGRTGLSLFVNGRWVQNRALSHAVEEAYRTHVRTGRHPVVIIFLEVDPAEVDVNVHPAKNEVRLLHERQLYGRLHQAVLAALPVQQHAWAELLDPSEEQPLPLGASSLRVLGQAGGTYIVVEGEQGLYLVDQHAAHERILLTELRANADRRSRQALLAPEVVDLPATVGLEPEEVCAALGSLGFEAEPFGRAAVLVRTLPAILAERQALAGLEEALDLVAEGDGGPDWRERLSLELACKTAIRAGDPLSAAEMLALVQQLGETHLNETCAHGRPTSILLSHHQLARQFGRL